MRKIAGYLTKNRSEKDQKIAQSTHENGYIKPRKTFWRNSKQLLNASRLYRLTKRSNHPYDITRLKHKCWRRILHHFLAPFYT
ncbi:hypothetical protein B5G04_08465 [Bacteroides sp. An51A]|nr:hypothetical protein B5G04_08465 [Bacteroides sp. An51A]